MAYCGIKKAAIAAALCGVFVLTLSPAQPAFAEPSGEDCKHEGKIKCDKWPGCRTLRDSTAFALKESGTKLQGVLLEFLHISVEDVVLQRIAESTQNLRTQILSLTDEWNACQISEEEYKKRSSFIYSLDDDADKINALIREVKELKNGRAQDQIKILNELKQGLKTYVEKIVQIKAEEIMEKAKTERDQKDEDVRRQLRDLQTDQERFNTALDARMTEIEKDVGEVKVELSNLRKLIDDLVNDKYQKALIVFETGLYAFDLNNTMRPGIVLGLEVYYPKIAANIGEASSFFQIGHAWWAREDSYSTLANMPSVSITQRNGFSFLDAGIKKYFSVTDNLKAYGGGLVGYSLEDDWRNEATDWFSGVVAGCMVYTGNVRTSFDLRYAPVKIAEKKVNFNPFGDTVPTYESRRYRGISLGVVFSLGVW